MFIEEDIETVLVLFDFTTETHFTCWAKIAFPASQRT